MTANVLVQFSSSFEGTNPVLEHMVKVYGAAGYPGNKHLLELPTWAAWVSGILESAELNQEFILLRDHLDVETLYRDFMHEEITIFGSVLDANKGIWQGFIDSAPEGWLFKLGGYISREDIYQLESRNTVMWFEDVFKLAEDYGLGVNVKPWYGLFDGVDCIPRLTLSSGCKHACSFCTIPRTVLEVDAKAVMEQVDSFKPLAFQYVYLDDKTFGQSSNYVYLRFLKDYIKTWNKSFIGFVVQTTVPMLLERYDEFVELGVHIAEIGVEFPDDEFLKAMHKPYRMKQLSKLMDLQASKLEAGNSLGIVPNILLGIPGADADIQLNWVVDNLNLIEWCNIFILSYYEEAKAPDALVQSHSEGDDNENEYSSRSWLTAREVSKLEYVRDRILYYIEEKWWVS